MNPAPPRGTTPPQAEHKIQSRDGPLELHLDRVPKALGTLRALWAPDALVVSFKLETDEALLEGKVRWWAAAPLGAGCPGARGTWPALPRRWQWSLG